MNNLLNKEIHKYLFDNDINNSRIGYMYLALAIELGLNNIENIYYIMKLYDLIAQRYHTNASSIGKAIGDVTKPTGLTGKEFISKAVYKIAYERLAN